MSTEVDITDVRKGGEAAPKTGRIMTFSAKGRAAVIKRANAHDGLAKTLESIDARLAHANSQIENVLSRQRAKGK